MSYVQKDHIVVFREDGALLKVIETEINKTNYNFFTGKFTKIKTNNKYCLCQYLVSGAFIVAEKKKLNFVK
jgi:hypothetical protein